MPEIPRLLGPGGRPLRVAHLTTTDMSLALLLETELRIDVASGLETFGLSAPGDFVRRVEDLGVRHISIPGLTRSWQPTADGRAAVQLTRVLRRLSLDVLHTHNPKTGVLGRMLGRVCRVPVVVNTCHGLWISPSNRALRRGLVLAAEGVSAWMSHVELYQNADDQAAMRWAVSPSRSRLVGNGIDVARFRAAGTGDRARVRAELGIGPEDLLVGGVGRLVAEKGVLEFAGAARALAGKARFVWVGPTDEAKADAIREELDGVTLLGAREDMPALYSALDMFVLPSHREGFSRSAMEAAAAGLPMVLSDIRGCREIGEHERHLLLVPPRDQSALVEAIGRLCSDSALRSRLGGAASSRANCEFDQREVACASLRVYAEVAERRGLGWSVDGAIS